MITDLQQKRINFWHQLRNEARLRGIETIGGRSSDNRDNCEKYSRGLPSGVIFQVNLEPPVVQLFINAKDDTGKGSLASNQEIFNRLINHRDSIEEEVGSVLEWLPPSCNKPRLSGSVRLEVANDSFNDPGSWASMIGEILTGFSRFEKAIRAVI